MEQNQGGDSINKTCRRPQQSHSKSAELENCGQAEAVGTSDWKGSILVRAVALTSLGPFVSPVRSVQYHDMSVWRAQGGPEGT